MDKTYKKGSDDCDKNYYNLIFKLLSCKAAFVLPRFILSHLQSLLEQFATYDEVVAFIASAPCLESLILTELLVNSV